MTNPSNTIQAQGPTALLALVQHIHEHGLAASLIDIQMPQPYMSALAPEHHQYRFFIALSVDARSLDLWLDPERSGLAVDHQHVKPAPRFVGGAPKELVRVFGRLGSQGIRVRLTSSRAKSSLALVPGASS